MDKQPSKNKPRRFGLTTLAVDNGTSIFLLTIMILFFGVTAYNEMPKEQFPEIHWPQIFINTPYFGNSAPDIESLITRPIEKELQSVDGIKNITSTSVQDYSAIVAEFHTEVPIEVAERRVKDAVDKAKTELPNDLDQDPEVKDLNFSEIPILTVNLSGDFSPDKLRTYAEYLQDEIEDIKEISEVVIKGALEREIKIEVDLPKIQALQITFPDIENAIKSENLTMSGGELVNNGFRRAIRIVGEFKTAAEIEEMIVKSENLRPIFLKDFAKATFGFKDRTSYARADGYPVISLGVIKRAGKNLLSASDYVKEVIKKSEEILPKALKISIFNDQSINTRNQVDNLENSIISGVILVVLVLLFFLGIRNAAFVGMAIPLSMLMGIMILSIFDVSMNIVVLFSLILALGLLVDNAIVVVENIYRYMQEGYSRTEAAKYGAAEVAMPIMISTATTLAAFLPLAFWPGLMGEFMKYMPITLIIVLTSSLFVALVINPVLTSRLMKIDEKAEKEDTRLRKRKNILIGLVIMLALALISHFSGIEWARNLIGLTLLITVFNYFLLRPASFYFQKNTIPWMERAYNRFIQFALRIPVLIFLSTFVLLIGAIIFLGIRTPKIVFFPVAEPVFVNAFVELPLGKDIEATNTLMQELEAKITKTIQPYAQIVDAVLSQIGENTADPNRPPEPGASPHKARLTVSFVPAEDRNGLSTFEIMKEIRNTLQGYPGVQITVDKNANGPPTGKAISIELRGENLDQLLLFSESTISYLNSYNIPGIEELKADVRLGKPELTIDIKRDAARRYGLSTSAIAGVIRTAVYGKEVSKFKQGEDEYPIFVRLDSAYRYNIDNILSQNIVYRNPANGQIIKVPISVVANVQYTSTYSSIKRKNLDRSITIFSNVLQGYNTNEIVTELQELMAQHDIPVGFSYEFTGEQQQQAEDMGFLFTTFGVALFFIFIIIVAQFNSIFSPFIIVLSILFSTIGVFLGYGFTNKDIVVVFTGVGVIALAGIVVNNAIVLIDYINLLVKNKQIETGRQNLTNEEMKTAIIQGGATRLRPVLLTAITTILGLIPLAVGFNFNFFTLISDLDPHIFIGGDNTAIWGPMAWTIIYGLTFATFLTLVVVPVMLWLVHKIKNVVNRLIS